MAFPSELVLMSLRHLNKADLKNARLVSKLWSRCASERLFTKLFISPHRLNLQVFVDIAGDPKLSKNVTELEYSAVYFSPHITISDYFDRLWRQTIDSLRVNEDIPNDTDPEIHQFVSLVKNSEWDWDRTEVIKAEARLRCSEFAFIQKGYQKWKEEAHFEQGCTEKSVLLHVLTVGLKSLSRLRTVKLRSDWSITDQQGIYGSPLARSWNPMHAHPQRNGPESERVLQAHNAAIHFQNLTSALSGADIPNLRNLWIESTIPPATMLKSLSESPSHKLDSISGVTNLKLCLAGWSDDPMVKLYDKLPQVSSLLEGMTALTRLELDLPDDYVNEPVIYFPYSKIFPTTVHWPHLTTFQIANLSTSTKNLITLLTKQMPSLQSLTFGNMRLLDGDWAGIIEYLKNTGQLSTFQLIPECALLHRNNKIYLALNSPPPHSPIGGLSYFKKIDLMLEYVVNGLNDPRLRHPSLRPGKPGHRSNRYLGDVYRLCSVEDAG